MGLKTNINAYNEIEDSASVVEITTLKNFGHQVEFEDVSARKLPIRMFDKRGTVTIFRRELSHPIYVDEWCKDLVYDANEGFYHSDKAYWMARTFFIATQLRGHRWVDVNQRPYRFEGMEVMWRHYRKNMEGNKIVQESFDRYDFPREHLYMGHLRNNDIEYRRRFQQDWYSKPARRPFDQIPVCCFFKECTGYCKDCDGYCARWHQKFHESCCSGWQYVSRKGRFFKMVCRYCWFRYLNCHMFRVSNIIEGNLDNYCLLTTSERSFLLNNTWGLYDPKDLDFVVEAQMDNEPQIEHTATVALETSSVIVSDEVEPLKGLQLLRALSSADPGRSCEELTGRWTLLGQISWLNTDGGERELLKQNSARYGAGYILPRDALYLNAGSPIAMYFNNHAYCSMDIHIRVHFNSNSFQQGCAVLSWYYNSELDANAKNRANTPCDIQKPHCIINLSSGEDANLIIPFETYKTKLSSMATFNDRLAMSLGQLSLRVLNPLVSKAGTTQHVQGAIYIRFANAKFDGLLGQDYVGVRDSHLFGIESEMLAAQKLVRLADDIINPPNASRNRDKPANYLIPQMFIPQCTGSLATGDDDMEAVHPLRLSAVGSTPHIYGPVLDEMSFDYLKVKPGLVNCTTTWSSGNNPGYILFECDAAPLWKHDKYPNVACYFGSGGGVQGHVIPTVANLAQTHCVWRGGLKLHVDMIGTALHTGSLLIGYIPRRGELLSAGHDGQSSTIIRKKPSLNNLKSAFSSQIDFGPNCNSVEFTIPYIADKAWWPRRENFTGNTVYSYPPGYVYVMVLNNLAYTDSVVNYVNLNFYFSGADDFEVAIPAAPLYTPLFYKPITPPTTGYVRTKAGYEYYKTGTWRYLPENKLILRYGDGSDHITQFDGPFNSFTLWELDCEKSGTRTPNYETDQSGRRTIKNYTDWKIQAKIADGDTSSTVDLTHFVRVIVNGDKDTYKYMSGFNTENAARGYITKWREESKNNPLGDSPTNKLLTVKEELANTKFDGKILWFKPYLATAEIGEKRLDVSPLTTSLMSTEYGLKTFGEKFDNVKSSCRRYQDYYSQIMQGSAEQSYMLDDCVLRIPVTPLGLEPSSQTSSYRYSMNGRINTFLSMYRLGKGGQRFKLFITATKGVTIFIQHRPDLVSTKLLPVIYNTSSDSAEATILPGFAEVAVNDVSKCVTFEVPYYLPNDKMLLQLPNFSTASQVDSQVFTLGELLINIVNPEQTTLFLQFKYCLADDFEASQYVGCPPMVRDENWFIPSTSKDPVHERLDSPLSEYDILDESLDCFAEVKSEMGEPEVVPEGLSSFISSKIQASINCAVNQSIEESGIIEALKDVVEHLGLDSISLGTTIVTEMAHLILNPSLGHLIISLGAILVKSGMFALKYMSALKQAMWNYYRLVSSTVGWASESEGAEVRAEIDGNVESAFFSTLVSGMCTSMKYYYDSRVSIPNFSSYLYSGLKEFTSLSNGLFKFFENNLKMFKEIFSWVIRKFSGKNQLLDMVVSSSDLVKKWLLDVEEILSPEYDEMLSLDYPAMIKVYYVAGIADCLRAKIISGESEDIVTRDGRNAMLSLCNSVIKKRDELIRNKMAPPVRFEPFVVCQFGEPETGKTHYSSCVSLDMLKAIKYEVEGELILVRNPDNPYWNHCHHQPILVYDDFLCITEAPYCYQNISELMILKSKAIFNPPQAAIPDKGIRYNPLIIMINTNAPYAAIEGLAKPEAWRRRRDLMIEVKRTPKWEGVPIKAIPREVLAKDEHVRFRHVYSSTVENLNEAGSGRWMNLAEYREFVSQRFQEYYIRESAEYAKRCTELLSFVPDPTDSIEEMIKDYDDFIVSLHASTPDAREMASIFEQMRVDKIRKDILNSADKFDNFGMKGTIGEKRRNKHRTTLWGPRVRAILNRETGLCEMVETSPSPSLIHRVTDDGEGNIKFEGSFEDAEEEHLCRHSLFDPEMVFSRHVNFDACVPGNSDRKDFPGFYNLYTKFIIPYERCKDLSKCAWGKSERFKADMKAWAVKNKFVASLNPGPNVPPYFRENKENDQIDSILKMLSEEQVHMCTVKWYDGVLGTIWEWFKVALKVAGILASLWVGWKMMDKRMYLHEIGRDKFNKAGKELLAPIQKFINSEIYSEPRGVKAVAPLLNPVHMVKSQMCEETSRVVEDKIKRNTFFISFVDEQGVHSARCLGLKGFYFIMLKHYVMLLRKNPSSRLYVVDRFGHNRPINLNDLVIWESDPNEPTYSDIIVARLPAKFDMFVDISKMFVRQKDTGALPSEFILYEVKMENEKYKSINHKIKAEKIQNVPVNMRGVMSECIPMTLQYGKTKDGLCGSVVAMDLNRTNCLVGIHVAGNGTNKGYAEILMYESFAAILEQDCVENVVPDCIPEEHVVESEMGNVMIIPEVRTIGYLRKARVVAPKSKLKPSECHGVFSDVDMFPPILSRHDERNISKYSPLIEGVKKHATQVEPFMRVDINAAVEDYSELVRTFCVPIRSEIARLTLQENVCGSSTQYFDGMELDTSEGWPLVNYRPRTHANKKWLFDIDYDDTLEFGRPKLIACNKLLMSEYQDVVNKLAMGVVPFVAYIDCLKDQKLPIEKIMVPGKVRVFSISPVQVTMVTREYMLDFCASFMVNRLSLEHAIGIDPQCGEWNDLAMRLIKHGNNCDDGDYKDFGNTLMPEIVEEVFNIISKWYEWNKEKYVGDFDRDQLIRSRIKYLVINAPHICYDLVYRPNGGVPPGFALTTVINSMCNSLYQRCAFNYLIVRQGYTIWKEMVSIVKMKRRVKICMSDFSSLVCMYTYGDDLLSSKKPEIHKIFSVEEIASYFIRHGIVFTNGSKNNDVMGYRSLLDPSITFLKRKFIRHETRPLIISQLDLRYVLATFNWIMGDDIREMSVVACLAVFENLHGHGEKYYMSLRQKVKSWWAARDVDIKIPTWRDVDERCYGCSEE